MCELKKCRVCDIEKELSEFIKDKSYNDGYRHKCKKCYYLNKRKSAITGIYKITSPTGKVYIGQAIDIKERFAEYKNLNNCKFQIRLWRSLNKHSIKNHIFEIIEKCSEEDLDCRERYWQDFYNVIEKNGLNCMLQQCGGKRRVVCQETKNRIGDGNRGKIRTDEAKEKMSQAHKGKTLTSEHKNKIGRKGELAGMFGRNGFDSTKGKPTIHKSLYIIYGSARNLCELLEGNDKNNTPYQYLEDFLKENPDFDILLFTYYKK